MANTKVYEYDVTFYKGSGKWYASVSVSIADPSLRVMDPQTLLKQALKKQDELFLSDPTQWVITIKSKANIYPPNFFNRVFVMENADLVRWRLDGTKVEGV